MLILHPDLPESESDAMSLHQQFQSIYEPALQHLWKKTDVTLSASFLERFHIRKGSSLDFDLMSPDDGRQSDSFFVPHPDTPEFGRAIKEAHDAKYADGWPHCDEKHKQLSCALFIARWFARMLWDAFPDVDPKGSWSIVSG